MTDFMANWTYPNNIYAGAGRIKELAGLCQQLDMKAPLFVTDPNMLKLPIVAQALSSCRKMGIKCKVFSEIQANPNGENVISGAAAYQDGGHDGVIAFGGGAALDAGKAIALLSRQTRPLWDFEDDGDNWQRASANDIPPIIAVPTTAGTGSEVGRAAVITRETEDIKKIIFHPAILPKAVILDPTLTIGLPPHITAATGMDALSHNLEALCAPSYHPMADGIAMEGIRIIKEYLARAFTDGSDIEARTQMLVASSMGATAFQKGLGGMHAMSHSLGALYSLHHGLLNAILMPYILRANQTAIATKIVRLSRYLGLADQSFEGFFNWVLQLRKNLQIPHTLSEIGLDDIDAEKIGLMSKRDSCASGNPIDLSPKQYRDVFLDALEGKL
ncbi:iron-containing alcohol dehydrogenase [Microbulbifer agarilyticus]|uniref:iron-containing alcohol dehydrogenase n=1 Tax=Microbulbifer agarilyticus TaxID=260552 RepID=UPI001CD700C4|nr:iron-containing alcohol dehydrogenase [Microbulbifer agarilyticus]MCA0899540.1 iron-containing alcohol dehydrogenase [Microbulbifer agarilyticus]